METILLLLVGYVIGRTLSNPNKNKVSHIRYNLTKEEQAEVNRILKNADDILRSVK